MSQALSAAMHFENMIHQGMSNYVEGAVCYLIVHLLLSRCRGVVFLRLCQCAYQPLTSRGVSGEEREKLRLAQNK